MKNPAYISYRYLLLSPITLLLSLFLFANSLPAQEINYAPKNIKGFMELDISTSTATRRVFEVIQPGNNFEGEATSTKVMARIATRPWRGTEFYLKAGMANLDINEFNEYRGDYHFAYGGGVAFRLYESQDPRGLQIFLRGDTLDFTTSDKVLTTIQSADVFVEEEIRWREYTIDSFGMWRSRNWEPYLGMRFSWLDSSDTIKDSRVGKLTLEEDRNLGLVAGTNIFLDLRENFALNLETTIIDQFLLKAGFKLWY